MFYLHHWHLPENSAMQLHVAKLPMKISVNKYFLRITYSAPSVTPPLAGRSGRRPPGMWRSPEPRPYNSPEPPPGSGRPGLKATHAASRRWWQPPKTGLGHPGDVYWSTDPQFWQCRLCIVSTSFQCCDDVVSISIRYWINVNNQHCINVVSMLNFS